MKPILDTRVAAVFAAYPRPVRERLLWLRELIFEVAQATPGVGELEETLKWGQPSYLTSQTKAGSTIRLGSFGDGAKTCALFFHCQTNLVSNFRARYGELLHFHGNRALVVDREELPPEPLKDCIASALTYHLQKKQARRKK